MSAEERLVGIRAKIERAKYHVNDLEVLIERLKESKFYQIVVKSDEKAGENVHWLEILNKIPVIIPIITGETIHQLRSSLDHLAWQLVEANGQIPGRHTSFPIFKAAPKDKAMLIGPIQGMRPDAIDAIEGIQPYNSGDDFLWRISELDNINKHRHKLIFAFRRNAFTLTTSFMDGSIDPGTVILPALWDTPIISENGTELFRLPDDVQYELDLTFDIAFGEPEIVKGNAIIKFLEKSLKVINNVVSEFSRLL